MNNSLLPPSASEFMRSTEQASTRPDTLPVDLNTLWNPDECPVTLLPYLAWALSVDRWDKDWPEETKRQAIKASWEIHRRKGTLRALRRVVEPFGKLIQVTEWWQENATPGTFRLEIDVSENGIDAGDWYELERLIADAKPVSRHLAGLHVVTETTGNVYTGGATSTGDIITVYAMEETWEPSPNHAPGFSPSSREEG
ncbi:phage tail protein I [Salmonella enterica]|uniref:Phage tail protein I n=1 Tax=Salmonella enterica TaxID=28901 RepID=A0A5U1J7H8_SALER|nr:phage tail protein I [Salmonella enterica]EAS0530924.1 phage tail protein I [Salmonella enterica]EAZ6728167.1 phage tail protein I [Salmonella enterica]EBM1562505.1 phage tail protein I [Salmonella enterica]EBM6572551.1 phage tail protein I [Salmonella enterica]